MRIIATVFGFVVLLMLLAASTPRCSPTPSGAPGGNGSRRSSSTSSGCLDHRRAGHAVLVRLGRRRRGAVHRPRRHLHRARPRPAERCRSRHLRVAAAVRAAVPAGRLVAEPTARGRVVEVNWRAVHIDTGNGIQIMPNAALASASFTNLSRPSGDTVGIVSVKFAPDDPPDEVLTMLEQTAHQLPSLPIRRRRPGLADRDRGAYRVLLPVAGPAEIGTTVALFQRVALVRGTAQRVAPGRRHTGGVRHARAPRAGARIGRRRSCTSPRRMSPSSLRRCGSTATPPARPWSVPANVRRAWPS